MLKSSTTNESASTEPSPRIRWVRASLCADGNCVEIGTTDSGDVVLIRDSKRVDVDPIRCTPIQFRALVAEIRAGTFDLP
jgi:Domain of unknown function (DUF397)